MRFDSGFSIVTATMPDVKASDIPIADKAVVASVHNGGLVLLHTRSGVLFSANRTGARIWRCVERQLSVVAIAQELSEAYTIPVASAEAHARRFLDVLGEQGLLVREKRR